MFYGFLPSLFIDPTCDDGGASGALCAISLNSAGLRWRQQGRPQPQCDRYVLLRAGTMKLVDSRVLETGILTAQRRPGALVLLTSWMPVFWLIC